MERFDPFICRYQKALSDFRWPRMNIGQFHVPTYEMSNERAISDAANSRWKTQNGEWTPRSYQIYSEIDRR